MTRDNSKNWKRFWRRVLLRFFVCFALLLPLLLIISYLISVLVNGGNGPWSNKAELKSEIKTIIDNGGELSVVEHAFSCRTVEKNIINKNENDYYDKNVTLSRVLNDLQIDYYLDTTSKVSDTVYLYRLEEILMQYSEKSPFDALEDGQKVLFENLKINLGENYDSVRIEILRISDALYSKNILTEKYLQRSNSSFVISLIALIVSILFGVLELWKPWQKKRQTQN